MPRLIRISWNTSTAARHRSSVSARMAMVSSPDQLTSAPVPRKSNRVDNSLPAWLIALVTSCRSTLLTTSNDGSATLHTSDNRHLHAPEMLPPTSQPDTRWHAPGPIGYGSPTEA